MLNEFGVLTASFSVLSCKKETAAIWDNKAVWRKRIVRKGVAPRFGKRASVDAFGTTSFKKVDSKSLLKNRVNCSHAPPV